LRDAGLLEKAVRDVIAAQSKAVADFRGGKESSLQFLIGQVMRETRGKANPKGAEEELRKQLAEG
jgi:aspartyl-tRNA(Asn)/glutamyl-tRNA(Gln) amidotransferase subunit B